MERVRGGPDHHATPATLNILPRCYSIPPQLGQLDAACPGMWSNPPGCSPPCYTILSAISPACRAELLSWERGLNTVQIQYGQPAYWLW